MADVLPNGLHVKVMICSICYITKIRLDVHFAIRKSSWKNVQQMKEKGYRQN